MSASRPHRLGVLSGAVFVVLLVLSFAVFSGDTPELKDSAQKVAAYYADNHDDEAATAIVGALGCVFGAIFLAHLVGVLRWSGPFSAWTALTAIGGTILLTGLLVALGMHLALAEAADHGFSPDQLRVLNALDSDAWLPLAGGMGLLLVGVGASMLARTLLPRALAWIAVAIGILCFTPIGFFALLAGLLWVLVVSVLLATRLGRPDAAAPTEAAPAI